MSMHDKESKFIQVMPKLYAIAYRMLASMMDAQDAVHETFIKWWQADHAVINNDEAWLTSVCTRVCIDFHRAAATRMIDYVGEWLPEPLLTDPSIEPDFNHSVNTAFLLILQKLPPKERAAYILKEIFDISYQELSKTLAVTEANCRKVVSRTRESVAKNSCKYKFTPSMLNEFIEAFELAVKTGNVLLLKALLVKDITLHADGGGKVPTISEPIVGRSNVLMFIVRVLQQFWQGQYWQLSSINNQPGLLIFNNEKLATVATFSQNSFGFINNIYLVRNPEKLHNMQEMQILTNHLPYYLSHSALSLKNTTN